MQAHYAASQPIDQNHKKYIVKNFNYQRANGKWNCFDTNTCFLTPGVLIQSNNSGGRFQVRLNPRLTLGIKHGSYGGSQ